jgi:hypothetical protein
MKKAFKPKYIHMLLDGDPERRMEFCLIIQEKILGNPSFLRNLIFSDEATFTTNGIVCSQNTRYWAEENPNFTIATNNQYYSKVNVWCAIMGTKILGPYFIEGVLNQHTYLEILNNFFLENLYELPLATRRDMWFQQDGCPAHSTRNVRRWLDAQFPERWVGRYGPVEWPPRSPDLTPLDFFLWGYIKSKVYEGCNQLTKEQLKNKIQECFTNLTPNMLISVMREFQERIEKCIAVEV